MNFPWVLFIHFGIISVALLIATLLRARSTFLQTYLIPNSLTAGFMLLIFYNYIGYRLGLFEQELGALVYHLLNLSFVSMGLRKSAEKVKGKRISGIALGLLSQYALQLAIGMGCTLIFVLTLYPDLYPGFGFLAPLGFALGPGQAYAIGSGWQVFGFEEGGSLGLTFAAIGFIWACFGGFYLLHKGIRKGWIEREELQGQDRIEVKRGVYAKDAEKPAGAFLTTESEAIDSLTFNISFVFGVYFLTYLFLKGLTFLLSMIGPMGYELAVNLWGIGFIFCGLTAMTIRKLLVKLNLYYAVDSMTLTRIGGTAVDYMVAGAIGAISIVIVTTYWLPILVISSVIGLVSLTVIPWMCSRIFDDHHFHRSMIIYGASTGTLSTGLILLRVIDPDFETPTVSDYMYASGIVFLLAIPLILSINLPGYGYSTGNPIYYWITALIVIAYILGCLLWYIYLARKHSFNNLFVVWNKKKAEAP